MKQRIIVALLVLLAFTAGQLVHAADLGRTFLPHVANGARQISSDPVTLDGGDNTYVGVALSSNGQCVFLAYIDRDDGNRLKVKQDAGDHLIDVHLPPGAQRALAAFAAAAPGYTAPGDKQAAGDLIVRGGVLSLYYTTRDEGDPSGSFKLKRLDIAEPVCQI